jgi:transposase
MTATEDTFAHWLATAQIAQERLTPEQRGLLLAAFAFRQRCGDDYYSNRLLSHFLLHCDAGLKVAQIARLVGVSRPTASHQQGVSSKEAIQAAHHRLAGRPHGKLLARYAGPIAEFILTHADATRYDILDFIERTWGVRVSTVALHHFCKKFGLDRATRAEATAPPARAEGTPAEPRPVETVPPSQPVPLPPPPFSRRGPSTRGRSSCCPKPWTG